MYTKTFALKYSIFKNFINASGIVDDFHPYG